MKTIIALAVIIMAPIITFAQTNQSLKEINNINDLTNKFTSLGNIFIQILIALAVIFIVFNVVRYLIMGADDEEKRKKAGSAILWGIVGLFVILSIWGLVRILKNTFNTSNAPVGPLPAIIPPQRDF
jgi:hypothetical protein